MSECNHIWRLTRSPFGGNDYYECDLCEKDITTEHFALIEENKMLRNNIAIRINGLDTARQCFDIAMLYHHGGTCQITNRCRPCVIANAIKEKFGLEI